MENVNFKFKVSEGTLILRGILMQLLVPSQCKLTAVRQWVGDELICLNGRRIDLLMNHRFISDQFVGLSGSPFEVSE